MSPKALELRERAQPALRFRASLSTRKACQKSVQPLG
jgi:hypothetical protein